MKKFFYLLMLLFIMYGCTSTPQKQSQVQTSSLTPSTEHLLSFFQKYKLQSHNAGNNIKRQEVYDRREKNLLAYIDSTCIIKNLEGKISQIVLVNGSLGKTKVLSFMIKITPEKYFELRLSSTNIIDKDSLATDYIYNKIKQISDYSTVYLDGVISIEAKNNLPRNKSYDNDLSISYPEYKFHVIDIAVAPLNDTINTPLRNCLQAGRRSMNYLFQKYRGGKYSESEFKKMSKEFNSAKTALTENELKYVQRYMNAIYSDIY